MSSDTVISFPPSLRSSRPSSASSSSSSDSTVTSRRVARPPSTRRATLNNGRSRGIVSVIWSVMGCGFPPPERGWSVWRCVLTARRRYPPGADDDVAFVEHRRLPGRHAVRGLVQEHAKAARELLHLAGHGRRAVAKLDVGAVDLDEEPPVGADTPPGEPLARPDHDAVRTRERLQRVDGRAGRDAEPLPLAGREAPVAVVRADDDALLVHDLAAARDEPAPLEESTVVGAAEEARF